MIQVQANTAPLVSTQFPKIFQSDGPTFVAFVQAYYQWLEQPNNALYYTRNYYNIKDIDTTFDQFIVYFKEKYLKNIQFTTASDIRTVIKHATDIYRSKGTERCAQLIFRLAFDKEINFYYPSKDLMRLSDGVWQLPQYLELDLNWTHNTEIEGKEVEGLESGAIAFVDSVIRRKTNGRLEDVAYISAITGNFQTGEKIVPTDGSLDIPDCPTLTGSLTGVQLPTLGSGQNYTVGDLIPVTSLNGQAGLIRVANVANQSGIVEIVFEDGGYGYQANANVYISNAVLQIANLQMNTANLEDIHYYSWMETITQPLGQVNYISATGTFAAGQTVYTYFGNGSVMGTGTILSFIPSTGANGVLIVNVLSGNCQNTFHNAGNTISANISANGYTDITATGQVIANASSITLRIANATGQFFIGEEVYQPLLTEDQKVGGFGYIANVTATTIGVQNVEGRFITGPFQSLQVLGTSSGSSANVTGVDISVGLVNTANKFIDSIYSYAYSGLTNSYIQSVNYAGTGLSVSIANSLTYTENVAINTDILNTYNTVALNIASYGFPANTSANMTNYPINVTLSYANLTIGKLASVYLSGAGQNFKGFPFIVIDQPLVSENNIYDDILIIANTTSNFANGELVTQVATGARGIVKPLSNTTFLYLQRMRFNSANDFVVTSNSTTTITGFNSGATANVINVDYDIMSSVMGRNANISPQFSTGNNVLMNAQVISSGFGFVDGEDITIGSNGAIGIAEVESQGKGPGYYSTIGGNLSDVKKLFDGYYWQNFSYSIISPIMQQKYKTMITDLTHVAGTIMFSDFVHNTITDESLNIQKAVVTIH